MRTATTARLLLTLVLVALGAEPASAQTSRELVLGREESATLSRTDPQLGGRPYHVWTYTADAARTLRIEMRSPAFDAYLVLQDSAGRYLAHDDNSGSERNARITYDVAGGIRYRVVARTFGDSVGAYTLRISEPTATVERITGEARRGQEVAGTLAATDPKLDDGRPYHVYLFTGTAGDSVTIEMRSDAFDAYVIVRDTRGRVLGEDDDSGGELNSRLVVRIPEAGPYHVIATGFSANSAGRYTLRVR